MRFRHADAEDDLECCLVFLVRLKRAGGLRHPELAANAKTRTSR